MTQTEAYGGTDNLEAMTQAQRYNRFLVSLVTDNLSPEGPCLDFGAGIGTFAEAVKDEGYEVEALDTEPLHQQAIRARGIRSVASLQDVPDDYYSGLYSLNVLEHIEEDEEILRELHRVLKPGGKAVIYVPAMSWLFTSMDVKVGHVRRYHLRELIRKTGMAGFRIDHAAYADSLGVLATLAFKVIGDDSGTLNPRSVRLYDTVGFPVSRAMDAVLSQVVGKNAYVVARKP